MSHSYSDANLSAISILPSDPAWKYMLCNLSLAEGLFLNKMLSYAYFMAFLHISFQRIVIKNLQVQDFMDMLYHKKFHNMHNWFTKVKHLESIFYLKKTIKLIKPLCCTCVSPFNFPTSWLIFMKSLYEYYTLKATLPLYFVFSTVSNNTAPETILSCITDYRWGLDW